MPLTELGIKNMKFEKRTMKRDDRGLYLIIHPNGAKYWKYRYKENGKEIKISLGEYPHVSLRNARQKRDEVERNISLGYAPQGQESVPQEQTFAEMADEWLKTRILPDKVQTYVDSIEQRLKNHILPAIGDKQLSEITPPVVLAMCRKIEARGIIETASRCKQIVGQVFKYAIATGRSEIEPTSALTGALKSRKEKHYPIIKDTVKIAALIRQINEYPFLIVRLAMQFSLLTFARPNEVRHAEWTEIDFDKSEWRIPAEKMKMRRPHIVPLSTQLSTICCQLKSLTGHQKWLFPSARRDGRPMSENTVRMALRTMGFSNDEIVPHGFRGMASTILNENGFPPDVIERQLAHVEKNAVRARITTPSICRSALN